MASFRGRAGFAIDRALFYVTGGAEIGGSTTTVVDGPGIGSPAGIFGIQWRFDHALGLDVGRQHRMGFQTTGAWPASIVTSTSAIQAVTSRSRMASGAHLRPGHGVRG
jgi:hypothetical protein